MKTIEIQSKEDFEKLIIPEIVDYASTEFEFCLVNTLGEEVIRIIDYANAGNLSTLFQEIMKKRQSLTHLNDEKRK